MADTTEVSVIKEEDPIDIGDPIRRGGAAFYCQDDDQLDEIVEASSSQQSAVRRPRIRLPRSDALQYTAILDFLESHLNACTAADDQPAVLDDLWDRLAAKLNAMCPGSRRSSSSWRRVYITWKNRVRFKARISRENDRKRTERGQPPANELTELEERALSFFGPGTGLSVPDTRLRLVASKRHSQKAVVKLVPVPGSDPKRYQLRKMNIGTAPAATMQQLQSPAAAAAVVPMQSNLQKRGIEQGFAAVAVKQPRTELILVSGVPKNAQNPKSGPVPERPLSTGSMQPLKPRTVASERTSSQEPRVEQAPMQLKPQPASSLLPASSSREQFQQMNQRIMNIEAKVDRMFEMLQELLNK